MHLESVSNAEWWSEACCVASHAHGGDGMLLGWWLVAGLAGTVTVTTTGALLRTGWNAWLVWALVTMGGWYVARLEGLLTDHQYHEVMPLRRTERQEALRRANEWRELRP